MRHEEAELALAQIEFVTVRDEMDAVFNAVETRQELGGLLVADDLHFGEHLFEDGHGTGVIGLHVVYNEIVDLPLRAEKFL
jgi:hypothetical protein